MRLPAILSLEILQKIVLYSFTEIQRPGVFDPKKCSQGRLQEK